MTLGVIWALMIGAVICASAISYLAGHRAGIEYERDRIARWQRRLERGAIR